LAKESLNKVVALVLRVFRTEAAASAASLGQTEVALGTGVGRLARAVDDGTRVGHDDGAEQISTTAERHVERLRALAARPQRRLHLLADPVRPVVVRRRDGQAEGVAQLGGHHPTEVLRQFDALDFLGAGVRPAQLVALGVHRQRVRQLDVVPHVHRSDRQEICEQ
jgi:hypothetical protein